MMKFKGCSTKVDQSPKGTSQPTCLSSAESNSWVFRGFSSKPWELMARWLANRSEFCFTKFLQDEMVGLSAAGCPFSQLHVG